MAPTGDSSLLVDPSPDDARALDMAAKYGTTEVLLSFGAADGGALFAQWLRLEILKAKDYQKPNNVYLDTFALGELPDTKLTMRNLITSPGGVATAGGLASMNEGWAMYYKYAMKTSHTMVFVLTKAWSNSTYCREEHTWYLEEKQARRARGDQKPLKGIGLVFPSESPVDVPSDLEEIEVWSKFVVQNESKRRALGGNYRDFWILTEPSLTKLTARIDDKHWA